MLMESAAKWPWNGWLNAHGIRTFWRYFLDQVLGPVAFGTFILAGASWTVQETISIIANHQNQSKAQEAKYIEILQKYKNAHRVRWIQGKMVLSALINGMPMSIVLQRKNDYDTAYISTNILFTDTRDYLDGTLADDEKDILKSSRPRLYQKYLGENLLKVTTVHDSCLTKAFVVRNDWEGYIWNEKINATPKPRLMDVKFERDKYISNILDHCEVSKGVTCNYNRLNRVYYKCAETIFESAEQAIRFKLKISDEKYAEWKEKIDSVVESACKIIPDSSDQSCEETAPDKQGIQADVPAAH